MSFAMVNGSIADEAQTGFARIKAGGTDDGADTGAPVAITDTNTDTDDTDEAAETELDADMQSAAFNISCASLTALAGSPIDAEVAVN